MFRTEKIAQRWDYFKESLTLESFEKSWPAIQDALMFLSHRTSQLYWPCLFSIFLLAFFSYFYYRPKNDPVNPKSMFTFLFPKNAYLSRSALIDYQIFAINTIFFIVPKMALVSVLSIGVSVYAGGIFKTVMGDAYVGALYWGPVSSFIFFFLIKTLLTDLLNYWVHRWFHTNAIIWPFHRVHHSAQALNPFTLNRKHPIFMLVNSAVIAVVIGIITAIVFSIFIGKPTYYNMLGVSVIRAVFNLTGSALRHTHIWISYGPILSKILISPAQHQVHHSTDKKHLNKNFGEIFALWDWMFGTLYVPKNKEELQFGLSGNQRMIHDNILKIYLEPIYSSLKVIWTKVAKPAKSALRTSQ